MPAHDLRIDETADEREREYTPATVDTWTLNDFDDLLYSVRRAAACPIGDEGIAFPS
jgi:hypothetical protein